MTDSATVPPNRSTIPFRSNLSLPLLYSLCLQRTYYPHLFPFPLFFSLPCISPSVMSTCAEGGHRHDCTTDFTTDFVTDFAKTLPLTLRLHLENAGGPQTRLDTCSGHHSPEQALDIPIMMSFVIVDARVLSRRACLHKRMKGPTV
jgi:hypothetical protein